MTSIVYFGSPDFSADILKSLLDSPEYHMAAVVTTPDVPTGRSQTVTPSAVAQVALDHEIPTFKPLALDSSHLSHLKLLKADLFLVVSFGKIIPQEYLDLPARGTLNVHFSLLPKYRGALCISEAIKSGDPETGVTLMQMDSNLDHGPILAQSQVTIDLADNTATLKNKLTMSAISLLKQELPKFLNGLLTPTPQDHTQATFTARTFTHTRQSAFIPWPILQAALSTPNHLTLHNQIRSLNPEPGAWTSIPTTAGLKDAKILETTSTDDKLQIISVQLAGKNPISWQSFLAGHQIVSQA